MVNCRKCKESIKPALIAVTIKGKEYHPACVSCSRCERGLWGKDYNRSTDGTLQCVRACTPTNRPPSAQPSSTMQGQSKHQQDMEEQIRITQAGINKKGTSGASRYKPVIDIDMKNMSPRGSSPPSIRLHTDRQRTATLAKFCGKCKQSVMNKKYITYEDGEVHCENCNVFTQLSSRPKSSHIILCSICNKTVRGTRYFTEPDMSIVCTLCDQKAARCFKCKGLFKFNESPCIVQNPSIPGTGIQLHKECFNCQTCDQPLEINNYHQSTNSTNLPQCEFCYESNRPHTNQSQQQANVEPTNSPAAKSNDPNALCIKCSSPIVGPCLIVENQPIHHDCFTCTDCKTFLDTNTGFYKNPDGLPVCQDCDQRHSSYLKCGKCFGAITGMNSVQHLHKSYHPECYGCCSCGVNLATMKRAMNDNENKNLYCESCFIKQLAPRCDKCREPIYMPHRPGTKFEGKDLHLRCFACARCKKTLANKKFFKEGNLLKCEICF